MFEELFSAMEQQNIRTYDVELVIKISPKDKSKWDNIMTNKLNEIRLVGLSTQCDVSKEVYTYCGISFKFEVKK